MSDFNWNFPADMKPSGRSLREVCEEAQEDFFKANGYYLCPPLTDLLK